MTRTIGSPEPSMLGGGASLPFEPPSTDGFVLPYDFPIRFWAKVSPSNEANGCWLWTAAKNNKGYGLIHIGGGANKLVLATRASWAMTFGFPIPIQVCHNCPNGDNPACVNPFHLWGGTHKQNMVDAGKKGRIRHLLNSDSVRAMREMRALGTSWNEIRKRFGVSSSTAREAILGITWSHVA